jgi:hypothetical protein
MMVRKGLEGRADDVPLLHPYVNESDAIVNAIIGWQVTSCDVKFGIKKI